MRIVNGDVERLLLRIHREIGRRAAEVDTDIPIHLSIDNQSGGHLHIGAVKSVHLFIPILIVEAEVEGAQRPLIVECRRTGRFRGEACGDVALNIAARICRGHPREIPAEACAQCRCSFLPGQFSIAIGIKLRDDFFGGSGPAAPTAAESGHAAGSAGISFRVEGAVDILNVFPREFVAGERFKARDAQHEFIFFGVQRAVSIQVKPFLFVCQFSVGVHRQSGDECDKRE